MEEDEKLFSFTPPRFGWKERIISILKLQAASSLKNSPTFINQCKCLFTGGKSLTARWLIVLGDHSEEHETLIRPSSLDCASATTRLGPRLLNENLSSRGDNFNSTSRRNLVLWKLQLRKISQSNFPRRKNFSHFPFELHLARIPHPHRSRICLGLKLGIPCQVNKIIFYDYDAINNLWNCRRYIFAFRGFELAFGSRAQGEAEEIASREDQHSRGGWTNEITLKPARRDVNLKRWKKQ